MSRFDIPQISRGFFATVMPFRTDEGRGRYDAASLRRTIQEVLAAQEAAAGSRRVDYEIYEDARYAMVALVDELAIVSDWAFRNDWAQEPLELTIFNTNVAGEEFFDRLANLRKKFAASRDEKERETILGALEVFYTCLECGFKGRHRGGDEGELASTKHGLLAMLWPEGERRHQQFFPAAYGEGGKGEIRRRGLSKWPFVVAGSLILVVLLYLVFQFLLGSKRTAIENVVHERTDAALEAVEGGDK